MGRHAYTTQMRFFRDDPRSTTVRWYFADANAKALPFSTVFCSSYLDSAHVGYDGLGEVYDSPRVFNDGTRPAAAIPDRPCGTADQFQRGVALPPPVAPPQAADGMLRCCHLPPAINRVADIDLSSPCVMYWLATCVAATYSNDGALFRRAVLAVLPLNTETGLEPNTSAVLPGWGYARLPEGVIYFCSGTTNLAQWLEQIFYSALTVTDFAKPNGTLDDSPIMDVYRNVVNTLDPDFEALNPDEAPALLCGHSMGSACMMAMYFKYTIGGRHPGSRFFGFGTPRMGTALYSSRVITRRRDFIRLATEGDVVCQAPPHTTDLPYLLPAPLAGFATRYNACEQTGPTNLLHVDGSITIGPQANLPMYMLTLLLSAAGLRPIPIVTAHSSGRYTLLLRIACPDLPDPILNGWRNPTDLDIVNRILDPAIWTPDVRLGADASGQWGAFSVWTSAIGNQADASGEWHWNHFTSAIGCAADASGAWSGAMPWTSAIGCKADASGQWATVYGWTSAIGCKAGASGQWEEFYGWTSAIGCKASIQKKWFGSFGPLNCSSGTNDASAGVRPWGNPGNITACDGSSASVLALVSTTQLLTGTAFGFNLNAGMTVTGMQASVTRLRTLLAGTAKDLTIQITLSAGLVGSNYADTITIWPLVATTATYGGPGDTWGFSPTPSNVNDATFGLVVQATSTVATAVRVDCVEIQVFWEM